ncbi:hypothetical protein AX15_004023 [Amanita polypyramis BW_CC]|nr:hypothetical protein AX15_004023 [Amanita polypyramis BW_CC]
MFAARLATRRVCSPCLSWQTVQYAPHLVADRHYSASAAEPPSQEDKADSSSRTTSEPSLDSFINAEDAGEEALRPEAYSDFMKAFGDKYRHASPRNWLGGEVPFPMNPSFLPPAPLSDAVRTRMYQEFMRDPVRNSVRVLSQRYHVSLKRVDAILRLKGLENAWVKGKQLQVGFQQGMEKLLGVEEDERIRNAARRQARQDWTRYDVHEADTLEQEEDRDAARQRYQRSYWESTSESGGDPIVPGALEDAKRRAKRFSAKVEGLDSNRHLMPRIKDTEYIRTPQEKVQVVTKTGRPAIEFHDVGSKFLNPSERLHRIGVAQRRARVRMAKRAEKEAAISN